MSRFLTDNKGRSSFNLKLLVVRRAYFNNFKLNLVSDSLRFSSISSISSIAYNRDSVTQSASQSVMKTMCRGAKQI